MCPINFYLSLSIQCFWIIPFITRVLYCLGGQDYYFCLNVFGWCVSGGFYWFGCYTIKLFPVVCVFSNLSLGYYGLFCFLIFALGCAGCVGVLGGVE